MAKDSIVSPMQAETIAIVLEKNGEAVKSKRDDNKNMTNDSDDDAEAPSSLSLEARTDSVGSSMVEFIDVDPPRSCGVSEDNFSTSIPEVIESSKPASEAAAAYTQDQPHRKPDPPSCDPWNYNHPRSHVTSQYIRRFRNHLPHDADQTRAVASDGDFCSDISAANVRERTAEDQRPEDQRPEDQRPITSSHHSSFLPYASSFASMASTYVSTANNSLSNEQDGGKRKIKLRLLEQQKTSQSGIDHGVLSVSWFEGTSTLELQEHVRKSLLRKIGRTVPTNINLVDLQILDTREDPPEEIVLSPHIPSGCEFVLHFHIEESGAGTISSTNNTRTPPTPPRTPPPTPSRHDFNSQTNVNPDDLNILNPQQVALLNQLNIPLPTNASRSTRTTAHHDSIEEQLKHITNILLDGGAHNSRAKAQQQLDGQLQRHGSNSGIGAEGKSKVVFGLAQYLLLFLSLIAISIEIQKSIPEFIEWLVKQKALVKDCAANQEALFLCVSDGDFAGLVASVGLWLSQSVVTRHIFLFGFSSSQKLWTVVYESAITGTCWAVSYLFIRRGLNPDTSNDFMRKYWKDAMYGSLAGFFAGFLKQVLKNLIPESAVHEAIRERTQMINWFNPFH